MQLPDKIAISPFVRIIIPFAIGIILSSWVTLPLWLAIPITVGFYGMAWLRWKTGAGSWYVLVAIFSSGVLVTQLSAIKEDMPRGERLLMIAQIDNTPYTSRGRWQSATAHVGYFQSYPLKPRSNYSKKRTRHQATNATHNKPPKKDVLPTNLGEWIPASEKIQLYIDTCYRIEAGEQITFRGYLNPIDAKGGSYGRLCEAEA